MFLLNYYLPTLGIFYSASWCGPCKAFIPLLKQVFENVNKGGNKLAVVWVNVNRDEPRESFEEYFRDMPWFAVPFENIPRALSNTADQFSLVGIPHFVLLDGFDASIVTLDGRSKVTNDRYGIEFPWRKRSLLMLTPRKFQRWVEDMKLKVKVGFVQRKDKMTTIRL